MYPGPSRLGRATTVNYEEYPPTPYARTQLKANVLELAPLSLFISLYLPVRFLTDNKAGIIYHDLKPENILLAADGHVKVREIRVR